MILHHAHDILEIIGTQEASLNEEALREICTEKFGDKAQFTNCSGMEYNFAEIMKFFIQRDKITIQDGLISLKAQNICQH